MRTALLLVALTLTACESARAGSRAAASGSGWNTYRCSEQGGEWSVSIEATSPPPPMQMVVHTDGYAVIMGELRYDQGTVIAEYDGGGDCTLFVWE